MRGRPPIRQHAVLDHLRDEQRTVLDLKQDRSWLLEITPEPESLIRNMRRRGVLHTLQRGRYLVNLDDVSTRVPRVRSMEQVAAVVLRRLPHLDAYVSWHGALWHHGLVDQQSPVVHVALRGSRKRNVALDGYEVRFVSVIERRFFGFEQTETRDGRLCVATVERAIVDGLAQPGYTAPLPVIVEAMHHAWLRELLDPDALIATALRFGSISLNRRLGFFLELRGMPFEGLLGHLGNKSAVPMVPGRVRTAAERRVNPRWRIFEEPRVIGAARGLK
jgi:predicted transcriptional regulator of viral defense system